MAQGHRVGPEGTSERPIGYAVILITGGAGYIGSHIAKCLSRAGQTPVVFDNLSTGHREAVRWGPLAQGDIGDVDHLTAVMKMHGVTAVIHCAGLTSVTESMREPAKYFQTNVVGTMNVLNAMGRCHVRDVVFSSSCATYGDPQIVPIPEHHPQHPVSPYGESKLTVEKLLGWYERSYGLRSAVLRYFNAAGADPDAEIGEDHEPETHLIPSAIRAALSGSPLSVFGTDYPTPDGTAIRDYIHVNDLAEAHRLALRVLPVKGRVRLNLGTGEGYSVRQVIRSVGRVTKMPALWREGPRRLGDPPMLVADAREAMQVLKWRPERSNLEAIVTDAVRWHTRPRASEAK